MHRLKLLIATSLFIACNAWAVDREVNELTERTTLGDDDVFYLEWLDGSSYKGRHIKGDNLATQIGSKLNLSGTYQGLDATLTALGGLTISSGKIAYGSGSDTFSTVDSTSFGRSLLNAADAAALRTLAGTGDVYQPLDATLTAFGGATITTGKIVYGTGSDTVGTVDSTSFGRSLLNAADAAALRTLAEISGQWSTTGNTSTFDTTVDDIGGTGAVFLNLTEGVDDYQKWRLDMGSILYSLRDQTGWTTASQVSLAFPHADGRNVNLFLPTSTSPGADAGTGKLAIYPSLSGAANKVLAVNSGETGVEWTTASGGVTDADYITKTANAGLSGEFALGSLSTGLLKVTTTTGDLSSLTNSSGLAGALSDETGSGALVFGTSPTISGATLTNVTISSGTFAGLSLQAGSGPGRTSINHDINGIMLGTTTATIQFGETPLAREASTILQIGYDAATAAGQGLKAADGSGTDKAGFDYHVGGGQASGTGKAGGIYGHTGMSATSSGSSLQSYTTRFCYPAPRVNLTESTATTIVNVAVASGKVAGGEIVVTTWANDGTDYQTLTSRLVWSAINKAGTVTATLDQADGTTATSSGTLSVTYTIAANGNTVDIKANAVSSLTQTTLASRLSMPAINSDGADTTFTTGSIVTPQ